MRPFALFNGLLACAFCAIGVGAFALGLPVPMFGYFVAAAKCAFEFDSRRPSRDWWPS